MGEITSDLPGWLLHADQVLRRWLFARRRIPPPELWQASIGRAERTREHPGHD